MRGQLGQVGLTEAYIKSMVRLVQIFNLAFV